MNVLQRKSLVHLLAQRPILLLEPAAPERARDQHLDLVEIERLGHKIVGAALHRRDRGVDRAVSRHHDADRRMRQLEGALDQRHAILAAEAEIGQQHIDLIALQHIERARDVGRDIGVVIVP